MARSRSNTPSYVRHKASGKARVAWYDTAGIRQQRLLPGKFNSKESRQAYNQLLLEIAASALRKPDLKTAELSVNELLLA